MIKIVEAKSEEMQKVKELFLEYQQWIGIDLSFQGFDEEMAGLPGAYQKPGGLLLLLKENETIRGCVAIRPRTHEEAEIKRLYLTPIARGKGYGKVLFQEVMKVADVLGYKSVVLDTLPIMHNARKIYIDFGFKEIAPYYSNPIKGIKYYRYIYSTQHDCHESA